MNKTPITRKSQGIRALPFPMKSSRQQRLPLSVQGISQLLRKSDDAAQEDFGTHMDWTIGKTPFVLYCAEHDPQGMIQHAVAALQIGHTLLWHEPSYRQDSQIAFDIEGIGSFELSPRSYYKHIGVFLHAHGSTSTEMKIRLPSPDLWPSLGLAWLLHPPTDSDTAGLVAYTISNPVTRLQGPFRAGGMYTSWNTAVEHAGLAFKG